LSSGLGKESRDRGERAIVVRLDAAAAFSGEILCVEGEDDPGHPGDHEREFQGGAIQDDRKRKREKTFTAAAVPINSAAPCSMGAALAHLPGF